MKKLSELKKGELFKMKESSAVVWVRGEYDRATKMYSVYKFDDTNYESFHKGTFKVFTDFEF
jgi:hypothetical protein